MLKEIYKIDRMSSSSNLTLTRKEPCFILAHSEEEDFGKILEANNKMNTLMNKLQKDLQDLDKRFTKGGRDFGKLALEKTKVIQKIINRGSDNVMRCVEIAGGAALTEAEIKATKKSEINRECPSIANPNYVPYSN